MPPTQTPSTRTPPTFAQLGVPDSICSALERSGITEPFEIQAATIADALDGRDVCGRAPTGSGKTLAFGIPLVAGLDRAQPKRPRALVLSPTRELADQIMVELRTFAGPVRIGVVYGGVGYGPQLKALRQGVDVLVACPGRLEDLIDQGALSLDSVERVVLDEADRMADMGFMPAVRRLLDQTSTKRQTVMFSATLDDDVAKLTRNYQTNPVFHEVGEETPDITAASHVFWNVTRTNRIDLAAEAVNAVWPAIIFCRTRHGSDRLAKQLGQRGVQATAIHGGRSQRQRTRALADFASGRVHALVATDVAARGIHVDGVASVIHYDPPEDQKAYVHRSGRTARAGHGGVVLSLIMPEQVKDLRRMQRQVGLDEPFVEPDGGALRDLSPAPERSLKPGREQSDTKGGQGRGKHQGGRKQGGHNNQGRNKQHSRRPSAKKRDSQHKNRHHSKEGGSEDQDSNSRESDFRSSGSRTSQSRGQGSPKRGSKNSTHYKDSSQSKNRKPANGKKPSSGQSPSTNGNQPNRKARRAHLQPGTAR